MSRWTRIPVFHCPSEVNDRVRTNASGSFVYPHTCGCNFGTWFVCGPASGGAELPQRRHRLKCP